MYGKMQQSRLTEIIPLMCASAIRGQYPVFSHPEFPQGAPSRGWLQCLMATTSLVYLIRQAAFLVHTRYLLEIISHLPVLQPLGYTVFVDSEKENKISNDL